MFNCFVRVPEGDGFIHSSLAGGVPTPLKNNEPVSLDDEIPDIWNNTDNVPSHHADEIIKKMSSENGFRLNKTKTFEFRNDNNDLNYMWRIIR